jgi:MFS transporter, PHS family, inorganic phosphate transporter
LGENRTVYQLYLMSSETKSPESIEIVVTQTETRAAETVENPALKTLDNAKFGFFHLLTICVSGMGFFSSAYDLFVISLLTKLLGRLYYPDVSYFSPSHCDLLGHMSTNCGSKYHTLETYLNATMPGFTQDDALLHVPSGMPQNIDSAIKGVALVGTLCGQLVFGYLGDKYGRKPVYGLTLGLMIVCAICSGLSFSSSSSSVISTLCFFRFFLGFGVGGDYPLSATLMSEYSNKNNRGQHVAAVFAQQGTGILFAAIITLIISACFAGHPEQTDLVWRIVLMLGSLPALLTLYSRLSIKETARFTLLVKNDAAKTAQDLDAMMKTNNSSQRTGQVATQHRILTTKEFWNKFRWQLFGCASTWFLLDIAYYSSNLFQPDVFTAAGWIPAAYKMTGLTEAMTIAKAQIYIALMSTIPGYWFTVFTIEKLGRIKIQVMGFIMMTLFMGLLAGLYTDLLSNHKATFIAFYALCFFFSNWGPNTTTYVIPSELFPTAYRSTAHGISAASGKLGATIGAFGFGAIQNQYGLQTCLICLTVINFIGLLCTYPIPETKGKSLEEISNDGISS